MRLERLFIDSVIVSCHWLHIFSVWLNLFSSSIFHAISLHSLEIIVWLEDSRLKVRGKLAFLNVSHYPFGWRIFWLLPSDFADSFFFVTALSLKVTSLLFLLTLPFSLMKKPWLCFRDVRICFCSFSCWKINSWVHWPIYRSSCCFTLTSAARKCDVISHQNYPKNTCGSVVASILWHGFLCLDLL